MPRDGAGRRRSRKVLRPRSINGIRTLSPQEVHERLAVHYGPVEWAPRADGMTELVQTILSQHTSDRNSGRAFAELWRTFRSWEAVLQAPTEQVMASIRQGGLARQKAPRIQAVLAQIWERRGDFDLSFLEALPLEEAKAWLTSLPGVGPKTAAIVLCFALGMPAFAIDTHIHRVTRRLGLIGPRVDATEAHDVLGPGIPAELVFSLHVYLITHGRQVCRARWPSCGRCTLAERCPSRLLTAQASPGARSGPDLPPTLHGGGMPVANTERAEPAGEEKARDG